MFPIVLNKKNGSVIMAMGKEKPMNEKNMVQK